MARLGRSFPIRPHLWPFNVYLNDIGFDTASTSAYQASLSSYSWSHTTHGNNRGLFVKISIFATGTVTALTYNGVAMTLLRADPNGIYRNEVWFLGNPALGTNTIAVTLSTSLTSIGDAVSYTNVDVNDMIEANNAATGSNISTPSVTLTTLSDRAMVVDFLTTSNGTMTVAAGQRQRDNNAGALGTGGISEKGIITPTSSVNMAWSAVGVTDSWILTSIAINPAGQSFNTAQTILGLARLTATTLKTILGRARITATATQTLLGKARITLVTTQTLLGKSRITATTTQTQAGKARVTATASQTQLGKSRITIVTSQTQLGRGRITATTTQTQLGKGRIALITSQTLLGKSRITIMTLQTQLGKSRITAATAQTQLGQGRITVTATQTILGRGRITIVTTQTLPGLSRITIMSSQTQLGKARLTATATQTQLGKSRVTIVTTQTLLAKSRITVMAAQTLLAKSRVTIKTSQTQNGRGWILITTTQTIRGVARITNTTMIARNVNLYAEPRGVYLAPV